MKTKIKISRTIIKKSRRFRQTLHHMKMSKTWRTKKPKTRPKTKLRRHQRSKPKVKIEKKPLKTKHVVKFPSGRSTIIKLKKVNKISIKKNR